jgi:hypothetical protein
MIGNCWRSMLASNATDNRQQTTGARLVRA